MDESIYIVVHMCMYAFVCVVCMSICVGDWVVCTGVC